MIMIPNNPLKEQQKICQKVNSTSQQQLKVEIQSKQVKRQELGTLVLEQNQKSSKNFHNGIEILSEHIQQKQSIAQTQQFETKILPITYKNAIRVGRIRRISHKMSKTIQSSLENQPFNNHATFRSFKYFDGRQSNQRYTRLRPNINSEVGPRLKQLASNTTTQIQQLEKESTNAITMGNNQNVKIKRRKKVNKLSLQILQGKIVHQKNIKNYQIKPEQIKIAKIDMPIITYHPQLKTTPEDIRKLLRNFIKFIPINLEKEEWSKVVLKKYKNCIMFHHQQYEFLWYYSGKLLITSLNCKHQLEFVPQKFCYHGQFKNKIKHGEGLYVEFNGNSYQGQWIEGRKKGYGRSYDAEKRLAYEGQWFNNHKEGEGILLRSPKQYYKGFFKKSKKNGYGIQIFKNGDHYQGEYSQGKFEGQGKYYWADGSFYRGIFSMGKLHGKGQWSSSGKCYIGEFRSDLRQGYGKLIENDGTIYEGSFSKGYKHGQGVLHNLDSSELKGIWKYGQLSRLSSDTLKDLRNNDPQPLQTPNMQIPSKPLQKSIGLSML